ARSVRSWRRMEPALDLLHVRGARKRAARLLEEEPADPGCQHGLPGDDVGGGAERDLGALLDPCAAQAAGGLRAAVAGGRGRLRTVAGADLHDACCPAPPQVRMPSSTLSAGRTTRKNEITKGMNP